MVDFQALAEKVGAEMRAHARRKGIGAASLRLPEGKVVDCRLVNVSPGGALIEVQGFGELPEEFNLIIASSDFEAACEVRHSRRVDTEEPVLRAGVMFMSNRLTALQRFGYS